VDADLDHAVDLHVVSTSSDRAEPDLFRVVLSGIDRDSRPALMSNRPPRSARLPPSLEKRARIEADVRFRFP